MTTSDATPVAQKAARRETAVFGIAGFGIVVIEEAYEIPMKRLVPDIPFPAYSYVPGLFPHPFSDAAGHRFGHGLDLTPKADADANCPAFRLGVDLFNHGYYWEAHEIWEGLWHWAGRRGPRADFFKALIQLAVVGVKIRENRLDGAETHARRAVELLAPLEPLVWSLSRDRLIAMANAVIDEPPTVSKPRQPVEKILGDIE